MIILGNIVEVEDECKFSVTWYHRVPIGLEKDTSVFLLLLPRVGATDTTNVAEVILSPINPERWGDLWKIRCKFHERPGVVSGLLKLLRDKRINILIQESVTLRQDKVHFVSIIADLSNCVLDGDNNQFTRMNNDKLHTLDQLTNEIAVERIEDLIMEGGRPFVTVTRMENLYQAYMLYRYNAQPNQVFNPTMISVGRNGEIVIMHKELIQAIKQQLWSNLEQDYRKFPKLKQIILNTHTEDRYISILFPDPARTIVGFKIVHLEDIGALHTIAEVIKELKLNILVSFNRLQRMGAEAHWNVILDIADNDSKEIGRKIEEKVGEKWADLILRIEEQPSFEHGRSFMV